MSINRPQSLRGRPNTAKFERTPKNGGFVERHILLGGGLPMLIRVTERGAREIKRSVEPLHRSDRLALSMLDENRHVQLLGLSRGSAGWPEPNEDIPR